MWYQHGVRPICVTAAALCVLSCGAPSPSTMPSASSDAAVPVDPARIEQVLRELPAGYEIAGITGPITPAGAWGFGVAPKADPPQCIELADPVADAASVRGWSGSGSGGIVYAAAARGRALDPSLLDECRTWTLSGGQSTCRIATTAAPRIDGAVTVAMTTTTTTVVEGGTDTHWHAETVIAHLRDHVAFVTVVTDPGSPNPQLGSDFAAHLMTETVSALRG